MNDILTERNKKLKHSSEFPYSYKNNKILSIQKVGFEGQNKN